MASTIQSVCDAVYLDLQVNVPAITTAIPHLYAAWDYSQLSADRGETHISVHINTEAVAPLSTDSHELHDSYSVLLWQDSKDEGAKGISDAAANLQWLELFEDIRTRLYVSTNQTLGGAAGVELCWYDGASFAGTVALRVMELRLSVKTVAAFT